MLGLLQWGTSVACKLFFFTFFGFLEWVQSVVANTLMWLFSALVDCQTKRWASLQSSPVLKATLSRFSPLVTLQKKSCVLGFVVWCGNIACPAFDNTQATFHLILTCRMNQQPGALQWFFFLPAFLRVSLYWTCWSFSSCLFSCHSFFPFFFNGR